MRVSADVRGAVETVRLGHKLTLRLLCARYTKRAGFSLGEEARSPDVKINTLTLEAAAAAPAPTAPAPAAAPAPILDLGEPLLVLLARQVNGQFVRRRRLDPTQLAVGPVAPDARREQVQVRPPVALEVREVRALEGAQAAVQLALDLLRRRAGVDQAVRLLELGRRRAREGRVGRPWFCALRRPVEVALLRRRLGQ